MNKEELTKILAKAPRDLTDDELKKFLIDRRICPDVIKKLIEAKNK
jgi:hypothetical protein